MKEAPVEQRLRSRLEGIGFKVVKLVCPGNSHVMDRMLIRPRWSPGQPWVVECKRPGKTERRAQELTRVDWTTRGMRCLMPVSNYEEVDRLVDYVACICHSERTDGR